MPVILLVAIVVVLLLSRSSHAAGAPDSAAYANPAMSSNPPVGPSTGAAAQWKPPTDITITRLDPVGVGDNRYGGNEADPRIAGGCWLNPGQSPPNQCCYDRLNSRTTCDRPIPTGNVYHFSLPGTAPPPPPPPPRGDAGQPVRSPVLAPPPPPPPPVSLRW